MRTRLLSFLLIFCYCQILHAQISGGGGITIKILVDKEGRLIDFKDPALVINKFAVSDSGASIRPYTNLDEDVQYHNPTNAKGVFIPLYVSIPVFGTEHTKVVKLPNQLIQFIYKGEITQFRFKDISMGDAGASSNLIDTLQLLPGSYAFSFDYSKRFGKPRMELTPEEQQGATDLYNLVADRGINRNTMKILIDLRQLSYLQMHFVPVVYAMNEGKPDTFYLPNKPAYRLKANGYSIGHKNIDLSLDALPMLERDTPLFRIELLVPYLYEPATDKDHLKALSLEKALLNKTLRINGQLYTGKLHVFLPILIPIGMRNLVSYRITQLIFREGKLVQPPVNTTGNVEENSEELPRPRSDV